jgi:light-regulated signal transduction histidine kinase (bacteriophytochrome)
VTEVLSTPPDLTACDREPIHIPGAVQPHGVLLVVRAEDGVVLQASANAAALFGQPLDQVLGVPYATLVTFREPLDDDGDRPGQSPWQRVALAGNGDGIDYSASIHFDVTRWLVEVEPTGQHFDEDPIRASYDFARRLDKDNAVPRAADRLAQTVRNLLGYDRVMVYRFDRDWHGEVIAEARVDTLEPYLGLHYPHTDIPAQARALYLRNRVRQIADVRYVPVPIVPVLDPETGAPADLSDVSSRAVSPVHVEYLGNMGVTGTLVASIIVGGRLWGLIACHHYRPLFADHMMREVTDALARAFAQRVDALEELAQVEVESTLMTVREKLITAFNESERIDADILADMAPQLLEVVDADGVAIFDGERIIRYGHLPTDDQLWLIRGEMVAAHPSGPDDIAGVMHTDAIGARFPALAGSEAAGSAAGLIFMPLHNDAHNAVLWTRGEQLRSVRWAGNPNLSKLQDIPGARLSPRLSFSSWQENVRGHSRPWDHQHLESARALRVLIELMERKHYQRSFALMRASLGRLPDAIVITDAVHRRWEDNTIVFVNDAFVQLAGHPADQLVGERAARLLAGGAAEADALERLGVGMRGTANTLAGLALRAADGAILHGQLELEPVSDDDMQLSHWLATFRRTR